MSLLKLSLLILLALVQVGCTTCHTTLIDMATEGKWKADLDYRICGSVSGFVVAVYRTEDSPPSSGEGGLEPFKSIYKVHRHEPPTPSPIKIKWVGDGRLLISHLTKANIVDHTTDLKVTKANTSFKNVSIIYEPKPVIWE